ncbi:DUF3046 domain-containing protein [Nanchangia anserum]|uniref:DUF3046 domain-containing protein n=1 Tax=Nanchangia anserum TaxID=2692125 RepID=A0A8I0GG98_9ACTO|nr:DUF3046 domain-containing protein [Nanchangia anserum]MBD3690267.1 DUF3046 domain-containing protein [Nanchangia anserum]QOX82297.1 DUF3046 domain-containing protein [Nanchangia anserum]
MRSSEFTEVLEEVLGSAYGRSVAADLYLRELSATANEALERGEKPQLVWSALVRELDLDPRLEWLHRADVRDRGARRR